MNNTPQKKPVPAAIPMNVAPTTSAAQAGQQANQEAKTGQVTSVPTLQSLKQQEAETMNQINELGSSKAIAEKLTADMLEAKVNAAPYDKKIAQVEKGLGKRTLTKYMNQGMSLDQSINLLSQDISTANSRVGYYETKKQEATQTAQEAVQSIADTLNGQLEALGLKVQFIGQQKQDMYTEQQLMMQAAAMGGGGGGGGRSGGSGSPESAMYYADLYAKGKITASQVPSADRDAFVKLVSEYNITPPEEVGMFPSYNQYIAQNYPNMSVDPNNPDIISSYQKAAQDLQASQSNSFLENFYSQSQTGANPFNASIPTGESFD